MRVRQIVTLCLWDCCINAEGMGIEPILCICIKLYNLMLVWLRLKGSRLINCRPCYHITFLTHFCWRHLWSFRYFVVSCVNIAVGIHSIHFKTEKNGVKTVRVVCGAHWPAVCWDPPAPCCLPLSPDVACTCPRWRHWFPSWSQTPPTRGQLQHRDPGTGLKPSYFTSDWFVFITRTRLHVPFLNGNKTSMHSSGMRTVRFTGRWWGRGGLCPLSQRPLPKEHGTAQCEH